MQAATVSLCCRGLILTRRAIRQWSRAQTVSTIWVLTIPLNSEKGEPAMALPKAPFGKDNVAKGSEGFISSALTGKTGGEQDADFRGSNEIKDYSVNRPSRHPEIVEGDHHMAEPVIRLDQSRAYSENRGEMRPDDPHYRVAFFQGEPLKVIRNGKPATIAVTLPFDAQGDLVPDDGKQT